MNDAMKKMIVTIGAPIIKHCLMVQALWFVSHGMISSDYTTVYVSLGMAAIGVLWQFWNDYGSVVLRAQMEIYKAKVLAQAAKIQEAGLKPVTVSQIAAQNGNLTTEAVAKAVAKMPPEIQQVVEPVAIMPALLLLAALGLSFLAFTPPAQAAGRKAIANPIINAFNALSALVEKDGDGAVKLSTQIPELQDYVGQACFTQIALIGQVVQAHKLPATLAIATDFEAARLVGMALNRICANPNCGQVWTDVQNVVTAINPGVIPVSLPSICAKIPVMGTVAVSQVPATPNAVIAPASPANSK
jgi:hypothetical protein